MSTPPSKSVPFCWQDKRVLRRIREGVEDFGSALAVYVALTVAASDKQVQEFQTTHKWLSMISGMGVRTVKRRLHDLQRVGVVTITTPALKAPCTYRLHGHGASDQCRTLGNGDPTLGHHGPALGHETSLPWPTSEESKKGRGNPLSRVEQISLEKRSDNLRQKLRILKEREDKLKDLTAEQWQREAPEGKEAVANLKELRAKIATVEEALLQ